MGRKRDAVRSLRIALDKSGYRGEPKLIRAMSSDIVFRVGDVAAKVFPIDKDLSLLEQRLAVIETVETDAWISAMGELHKNEFGSVAFYPWARRAGSGKWPEIGTLLHEVHNLDIPAVQDLPRWMPLRKATAQLSRYALDPNSEPDISTTMLAARTHLLSQVANLESDLGWGFIHGDVSPSNTARVNGKLAFIDLDECAYGPREYDLVGAAMRFKSGEIRASAYARFCDAYGYDVRKWKFLPAVEEIAALGAATFILGEDGSNAHNHPCVLSALEQWGEPGAARRFKTADIPGKGIVIDGPFTNGSRLVERGLTINTIELTNQ